MEPSELEAILGQVYIALKEKGYDPIAQIMGYILNDDPQYITHYNHARGRIKYVDRHMLMRELLSCYISSKMPWIEQELPPISSQQT